MAGQSTFNTINVVNGLLVNIAHQMSTVNVQSKVSQRSGNHRRTLRSKAAVKVAKWPNSVLFRRKKARDDQCTITR